MKDEVVFYERQRFSQSWAILIIGLVNALFIFGCIMQLGMGKSWGNHPMDNTMLIIVTAIVTLLTISFFFSGLDTVINKEGVYFKLFPFCWKYKSFPWDMVSKAYVRKYNPILEYGGWGIRYRIGGIRFNSGEIGRSKMNIAYNISGNMGLQLELANGKRVLIGTRKPAEMEDVLQKLNKNFT